jgi:hypothetical protein
VKDSLHDLRSFVAPSWYEACGGLCDEHLPTGTEIRPLYSTKRLNHYARYLAKTEKLHHNVPNPGRLWGVRGRKRIPVDWETERIGLKEAIRLRRIFRRLSGRRGGGHLRPLHVFIRYENVVRLLSWMGCYRG